MIDIDKIRQDCHGWVDEVIGSSNAGLAHHVVDAVVDSAENALENIPGMSFLSSSDQKTESASPPRPEKPPLWTPGDTGTPDSVDLYQNDPHMLMIASLLEQRDTATMRATMSEEVAGAFKVELEQAKSARIEETQRADEATIRATMAEGANAELAAKNEHQAQLLTTLSAGRKEAYDRADALQAEVDRLKARLDLGEDQELAALRKVHEAAKVYWREFNHLVGPREYPERTALLTALEEADEYRQS